MKNEFVCPCCGYDKLSSPPYEELRGPPVDGSLKPPYAQYFGMPSYEVCSCCGFEFGNDDDPGTREPDTFCGYLSDWIADGAIWFSPERRPSDWSLDRQLQKAGISLPN